LLHIYHNKQSFENGSIDISFSRFFIELFFFISYLLTINFKLLKHRFIFNFESCFEFDLLVAVITRRRRQILLIQRLLASVELSSVLGDAR
jgi:hypothetical protein